ncbi:MAG: MFS transporter [Candidatus Krumholzibacteria bacterium]|nr:MFS transporter [Candidatus Krumholzibacteria bacterium]MDH4337213.1 MFS transporter [Candidatus Krumholzibacteria bacterium]MDH5268675.1 MFS transporter [Candidatus Krumholzibacteria bacterium]MDH5628215.1 MFS transporter [Candidatus Krumholzibacteria bacterium]
MIHPRRIDRPAFAWALYDWANSAFSTTVMAGFFPVMFKQYWCAGADVSASSARLGFASSVAGLVVALAAPALGAVADAGESRKRFLLIAAGVGVAGTAALFAVPAGQWVLAAVVFIVATAGFSASMIFYDALLVDVSTPRTADFVSAYGFALGYLGGGILFLLNIFMYRSPATFGIASPEDAARWSFLTVAVWWALFSIPLARGVRERAVQRRVAGATRRGLHEMADTLRHLRRHRAVLLFLLGYWFYIDGVHTIVRMGMDYGLSLGFPAGTLILSLLLIQFVGFPASLLFGKIGDRYGARTGIYIAIAVYIGICIWGYLLSRPVEFYALAVAIGLVQGGINSLSRSFYSRLIPENQSAQFFGYYNTIGRFSAVLGPAVMGTVSLATGNPRLSMLAMIAFFVAGAMFLARVPAQPLSSPQEPIPAGGADS